MGKRLRSRKRGLAGIGNGRKSRFCGATGLNNVDSKRHHIFLGMLVLVILANQFSVVETSFKPVFGFACLHFY